MPTVAPLRHVREAFDRSVALVLGVNTYGHGVPRLKTAVSDAEAVGAVLESQHGFAKVLCRDTEVTVERVRSILQHRFRSELDREVTERDRLLVYFAGHGLSLPSEHGPEGQLLFADADPADPRSFFAMSELRTLVSALPCRHVLIVLDCCFAGTFRWAGTRGDRHVGLPAYRETLERFVKHRAWQVLVSASHDQTALDTVATRQPSGPIAPEVVNALGSTRVETEQHSPFAVALLRGLQGEADFTKDKLMVATELELYVRDAVEKATHVHQTPQLYKLENHDRGEFVFQVPGTTLDLDPAPALALAACPYQGLRPYGSSERARFFGRKQVLQELIDHVKAHPFTAAVGPSGIGKSSLLAAGLGPALRETNTWTVLEARPGTTPDETLRDLVKLPTDGGLDRDTTLFARITAWMTAYPAGQLCLVIDQAEELETLAGADARTRALADLAQALEAHGIRLRVVLALRSEFEPLFRASVLAPFWGAESFVVPALTQDELREIIERPARSQELAFEPPELVDTLINEVLQAPGALPLLSFALRELYAGCVERNRDRLLTEEDYVRMGRLSGALSRRATELLDAFVAKDDAYAATARRVFLRMVVNRDGEYVRRRVHRDEFVYADDAENARVDELLTAFKDARLVVFDKDEWEPAHDDLVREWNTFSTWRRIFGDPALALQLDVADATRRWDAKKRSGDLWHDDERLRPARRAARDPDSWLNARERGFVAASERRRRIPIYAAFGTLALVLLSALTIWDLYYRVHVDYFTTYVRRWGEPKGVDPLSEDEARGRVTSFKLVRNGRLAHISHVEHVRNGEYPVRTSLAIGDASAAVNTPELEIGQKEEGERMPSQWDFEYDDATDTVSTEIAKDRSSRVIYTLHYRSGPRGRRQAEFLKMDGFTAPTSRGDAEIVEFVRSSQGLDEEKHYFLRGGERARNGSGVSVEKYRYDERGHLIHATVFDVSERPMRSKEGVAGVQFKFDDRGNQTEIAFFDEAGKPIRFKGSFATSRSRFDDRGNQTEIAFFDEAGKPTRLGIGAAGWRSEFDERGNATEIALFDEAGKPTRLKGGVAGWRSKFDGHGNETEHVYLDEMRKPTRQNDGVAGWRSRFDDRGNQTERAYFEEAGKPTRFKDGYAGWWAKFDDRGNEIELAFFDKAGKPTRQQDGYAGWRSKFDDRDNETERAFFGETRKPTRGHKEGVAGWRSKFDDRGNQTEIAFFDEAGKPTRHKDGYAGWRSKFNEWGNETERAFFDVAGKPRRQKGGAAGWWSKFDDRGNETERAFFDEAGKPTRHNDGYAGWRSNFNERGTETERAFFDEAGKPTRHNDGYAGWRSKFDERGNETERAFFDEAGSPTRLKVGYAGWRSKFDERGNESERAFFDEEGSLIWLKEGLAGWWSKFDDWGNETERAFFDENGSPTRYKDGYATWRSKFDDRGNRTETAYFDEAGKPTRHKDGYAVWRSKFDERSKETERAYFDETGKPTRLTDGIAGWRSKFDEQGNETDRAFFDTAGSPTRHKDGYAGVQSKYDDWGNQTQFAYLDEAGKPTRHEDGIAGYRSTFDERGNETERVFFDETGKPTRHKDGYAGWRSKYDDRGNQTELDYFDEAGKPTLDKDRVAYRRWRYNAWGNVTEGSYFDEAGKPTQQEDGVASYRSTFDERGNETERALFDRAGNLRQHKVGYAGWRSKYDEWGDVTEVVYFNEAGKPFASQH